MTIITGCNARQKSTTADEGVVINGVRWATRNVDAPVTFALKPEDTGMFYQWNRAKAWPVTGEITEEWAFSGAEGQKWEKENDPSPAGWRAPTYDEMMSLIDTEKVSRKWANLNGVNGCRFTDKTTGKSIFLPAAGSRGDFGGLNGSGLRGYYWAGDGFDEGDRLSGAAVCLKFFSGHLNDVTAISTNNGFSLRSVAE